MAKIDPRPTATKAPQCSACGFYLPVAGPDGRGRELRQCPQCGARQESLYRTQGRDLLIGLAIFVAVVGFLAWYR